MECCITLQHSIFLCNCLYSVNVGADNIRPRAINNRPYEFYRRFCVFCNTPVNCLFPLGIAIYFMR